MRFAPDATFLASAWLAVLDRIARGYRTAICRALASADRTATFYGTAKILNATRDKGRISVGAHTVVRGELFCFAQGRIEIGAWCYVGEQSRLWSAAGLTIGDRVLISHHVDIHDTISHPIGAAARHAHIRAMWSEGHPQTVEFAATAVRIEDDAWIGFGAAIMRGVTVGRGAIVSAHAMVTEDVAPWTVVGGNPARVIRQLEPETAGLEKA